MQGNYAQMELQNRLLRFAIKHAKDRDVAEEAASDAMLACIERNNLTFNYGVACVKNYIAEHYAKVKRRKTGSLYEVDDEGEHRLRDGTVDPNQNQVMFIADCVFAIEKMSDKIRPVMERVALEWTADEIAAVLDLPLPEVQWRIKYGRKLLRGMAGYGLEAKRGHHKYIGIRRKHHRWEASVKQGDHYYYLGHFGSAAEAAKAYDTRARELFGAGAKTNFPGEVEERGASND